MKNIIVIYGGKSVEHDISILTAIQTIKNINKEKYNIYPIYQTKSLQFVMLKDYLNLKSYINQNAKYNKVFFNFGEGSIKIKGFVNKTVKIDCAINCCHGLNGEDGTISALMNMCNIPITSGSLLSGAICMDKIIMKDIFKANDIPCVNYCYVLEGEYNLNKNLIVEEIISKLKFPLIVKPSNLGSSIGIEKANNVDELIDAIDVAFYYDSRVIVEECLTDFKEINISCLGSEGCELSCLEQPTNWQDFLNFDNKYIDKKQNSKILNPKLNSNVINQIETISKKVFKVFNLSGVIRIDFMVKKETVFVNEINTVPGSLAFYLWKQKYEFFELIDKLIDLAIQDFKNKSLHKYTYFSNVLEQYKENSINKYAK